MRQVTWKQRHMERQDNRLVESMQELRLDKINILEDTGMSWLESGIERLDEINILEETGMSWLESGMEQECEVGKIQALSEAMVGIGDISDELGP